MPNEIPVKSARLRKKVLNPSASRCSAAPLSGAPRELRCWYYLEIPASCLTLKRTHRAPSLLPHLKVEGTTVKQSQLSFAELRPARATILRIVAVLPELRFAKFPVRTFRGVKEITWKAPISSSTSEPERRSCPSDRQTPRALPRAHPHAQYSRAPADRSRPHCPSGAESRPSAG